MLLEELDMAFGLLIDVLREAMEDEEIKYENLGVDKHFFFVNRATGTLIDNNVPPFMTLKQMKLKLGQRLELCLSDKEKG